MGTQQLIVLQNFILTGFSSLLSLHKYSFGYLEPAMLLVNLVRPPVLYRAAYCMNREFITRLRREARLHKLGRKMYSKILGHVQCILEHRTAIRSRESLSASI